MRRGSPGRGNRRGLGLVTGLGMSPPAWRQGTRSNQIPPGWSGRGARCPCHAERRMGLSTVTAAMIARSRTIAEARWSPGGGLIGWIDGFDGRYDLVIARSDGGMPPVSGHCGRGVDAGRRLRRRGLGLGQRARGGARSGRRPLARGAGRRRRHRPGAVARRHGRRARRDARRRAGRLHPRTGRRLRRGRRAARRIGLAGARESGRLRVGPGVVARRSAARVARVGPPGDAVGGLAASRSRGVHADGRDRRGTGRRRWRAGARRGSASRASRPRAAGSPT